MSDVSFRTVTRHAEGLDLACYAGRSMRQTRHTSVAVARKYNRDGCLFRANMAGALGV